MVSLVAAGLVGVIAGVWDARTGRIPNRLTVGALIAALVRLRKRENSRQENSADEQVSSEDSGLPSFFSDAAEGWQILASHAELWRLTLSSMVINLSLAIFAAVMLGGVVRIVAAFQPESIGLLHLSALLWSAAFLGFAVAYGGMLLRPRLRPRQPAMAPAAS